MDPKEQEELAEVWKLKKIRAEKNRFSQQSQVWEFENYIKERLRSLGIIQ